MSHQVTTTYVVLIISLFIFLFNTMAVTGQSGDEMPQADSISKNIIVIDTSLAHLYYDKAIKHSSAAEFDSANRLLKKSAAIFHKFALDFGSPSAFEQYCDCYNQLGNNYMRMGQYEKSMTYLDTAMLTAARQLDSTNIVFAQNYHIRGIVNDITGNSTEALNLWRKSLNIKVAVLGENHPEVAKSYTVLGLWHWSAGDYKKALKFYRNALLIAQKSKEDNLNLIASIYNNLGMTYKRMAIFEKALEAYRKALKIRIKTVGDNHPEVGNIYNNMGLVYSNLGDYQKAIEYYEEDKFILESNFGKHHPSIAASYNNIGILYEEQEQPLQALENYKKSLAIRIKTIGENHHLVADTYNNIGIVYTDLKNYRRALDYHRLALNIRQNVLGEENVITAVSYFNIGETLLKLNRFDDALVNYRKSLAIRLASLGSHHPDVAEAYLGFFNYFYQQHVYERALFYTQKAIHSLKPDFRDNNIYSNPPVKGALSNKLLLFALNAKANAFKDLYANKTGDIKDLEMATATYLVISNLIDHTRKGYIGEGSKYFLGERAKKIYEEAILTSLHLFEISQNPVYREQAFTFMEKSKASILLESIAHSRARHYAGIPDSVLRSETSLKEEITSIEQELLKATVEKENEKITNLKQNIFALNNEYQKLIGQWESDYPEYYKLRYSVKTISIGDIQNDILGRNDALIEYFTGDSLLVILTITKQDLDVHHHKLNYDFGKSVKLLRTALLRKDYFNYTKFAHQLYEILIEPVAEQISGKNLIIISDGFLNHLPFEALLTREAEQVDRDYRFLSYLVKEHVISYAYSATLLWDSIERGKSESGVDFLAFAPVFDTPSENTDITELRSFYPIRDTQDSLRSIITANGEIKPIPFTEEEVNEIERLFNDKNRTTKSYILSEATEANFKKALIDNCNYLHIATHGIVNEENPQLSAILFASDTTSGEDGILYASEVYNLDLDADLVVLSACETGLGRVINGEGLIGLSRGFLYAGASNLLVSLWRVTDRSTSELMTGFYANLLNSETKAQALWKSKLNLIVNEKFAAPYFWSPMVLIGN